MTELRTGTGTGTDRYSSVSRVLWQVLVLNVGVALAKLIFGYATGAVSIISDGFHSLTDSASNVVALVGIRMARQPPDENHPYGHRKFETLASAAIFFFLLLVLIEVLRTALGRFQSGGTPDVSAASFVLMGITLAINLGVVAYESSAARRHKSELLMADSHHTRSDVFTSLSVIGALAGVKLGYPILDPLAALLVAGFIGWSGWLIAREASRVLSDATVLSEADVERVVMSVPGVLGCHHIRTRGSADHAFLDLHVWAPGDLRLEEAHALSHVVKDRLLEKYPELADVIIHIEPPPKDIC
ncbi:MAG TPA: cation diffusion facilitator family transporter [Vicinamibacterales bacterium]|nr:cation diffusion facilitator family transporter [Vicinamibacterales bacterium]